jgi:hypothetical protein
VRTKRKAAMLVEQRLARDRTEAHHDARALAIELVHGVPSIRFDPMVAGVVLQPGETAYRLVLIWIRVLSDGRWAGASSAEVVVTDLRLLCRFGSGSLVSLWWSGIVGLRVDLAAEHVVLDFGDGQPVNLSGARAAQISVAAIASIYGVQALVDHPALALLRVDARPDVASSTDDALI